MHAVQQYNCMVIYRPIKIAYKSAVNCYNVLMLHAPLNYLQRNTKSEKKLASNKCPL